MRGVGNRTVGITWMGELHLVSDQDIIKPAIVARNMRYYQLKKITELGSLSTTARRQRDMTGSS